jgi:hypothetical protein
MRRILVCTGVLGGGTVLVFALAATTAMLFPQGTLVPAGWNGGVMFGKGMPVPQVMPAIGGQVTIVDDSMTIPTVESPAIALPDPAP